MLCHYWVVLFIVLFPVRDSISSVITHESSPGFSRLLSGWYQLCILSLRVVHVRVCLHKAHVCSYCFIPSVLPWLVTGAHSVYLRLLLCWVWGPLTVSPVVSARLSFYSLPFPPSRADRMSVARRSPSTLSFLGDALLLAVAQWLILRYHTSFKINIKWLLKKRNFVTEYFLSATIIFWAIRLYTRQVKPLYIWNPTKCILKKLRSWGHTAAVCVSVTLAHLLQRRATGRECSCFILLEVSLFHILFWRIVFLEVDCLVDFFFLLDTSDVTLQCLTSTLVFCLLFLKK